MKHYLDLCSLKPNHKAKNTKNSKQFVGLFKRVKDQAFNLS